MPKQAKIVTFINDREGREQGEEELTRLLNEGYEIASAGGGTGAEMVWGFVVLQRETTEVPETIDYYSVEDDEPASDNGNSDPDPDAETTVESSEPDDKETSDA